jgi:hypothetical protein
MPNVGSYNGKWSGEGRLYAIVKSIHKNKCLLRDGDYYHYNFGDGWSAGVRVSFVNSAEAARIRRKSAGFCGYEWMVKSIIDNGKIIAPEERHDVAQ